MISFDSSALTAAIRQVTNDIGAAIDEPTLRATGFAGAEVFREQAKVNALRNKKTGTIYNNIIAKRLTEESDGDKKQAYLVTVRSGKFGADGDAFYWRFVEQGHKFVPRKPKSGKGSTWKAHRRAAELEYGSATVPAYPFMRPAYEARKADAIEVMRDKLAQKINEKMGGSK
ncbi:HK97-gp10 family putative phage morphogenesis protein [Massilia soli]|uniref:HK97 gp10 family phage protein n=1 Tax=Massilia soli TaxID=2792854 RepID=A0ABS7SR99_9BURK|nr:HK97 gp10 family phage protein [Massilia soli]